MNRFSQFDLTGKVAIVTGSSRGIGRAIAFGFAKVGADVVVLSRHLAEVQKVAAEIESLGRRTLSLQIDVSNRREIDRMVEETMTKFGKIDILVNNAGIPPAPKRAEEITEEEWDQNLNINLKGLFLCCQAVGRKMIKQKRGKIINMSSILGNVALSGLISYSVSKAGIIQITKNLAIEWAKHNINVNALAPGWVETGFRKDLDIKPKIYESYIEFTPLKRFALPEEIVGAAIFLASEASNYVTGATLFIDGGWTAR